MVRTLLLILCLLIAGCQGAPAPALLDVAQPPAGAFGTGGDPDQAALDLALSAFTDSSTTYGRPAQAARAVAALDYLAGAASYNPRWAFLSADTKQQLLQAREDVRQAIGVVPGTSSQTLVDHLIAAANALGTGNQDAAVQQLGPPVFNASGTEILARLSKLPYLQSAGAATTQANDETFQGTQNNQPTPGSADRRQLALTRT